MARKSTVNTTAHDFDCAVDALKRAFTATEVAHDAEEFEARMFIGRWNRAAMNRQRRKDQRRGKRDA